MNRVPMSLYNRCLKVTAQYIVKSCIISEKELRSLPNNILFDCFYELYLDGHICLLVRELGDIQLFNRLILLSCKDIKLIKVYQELLDHGNKCVGISDTLIESYKTLINSHLNLEKYLINIGLRFGGFFNEGSWYNSCIEVTKITEELCHKFERTEYILKKLLECYNKKLYAEVASKELLAAENTYRKIHMVIKELENIDDVPNLASIYTNFSALYYMKSEYNEALEWSQKALQSLNGDSNVRTIIDVLRQASKSCIVKRRFNQSGFLIKQALKMASDIYVNGIHPHYTDTLSDYGFYLLNSDSTAESVKSYKKVLSIRQNIFNKYNISVALAHEDLAYVLYVHEYSSGVFSEAGEHAEKALKIMNRLLHPDHLLMASAKRVKALIIEEVALDIPLQENDPMQANFLKDSEELHKEALASSLKTFGEKNVLTAKQYGNLGRLYQSMKKLKEAEEMHLKAIAIKEELLGESDYEVALSLGHLASLYNYQMCRYVDAEKLYIRSIAINSKLFGETYSGLEYDYRGISHVYVKLLDLDKVTLYEEKMREWRRRRSIVKVEENNDEILPWYEIVDKFFEMC